MYEFLRYRVRHAMTRNPVTVAPGAPLHEVEALFERHQFNALPILDRSQRLVAIVTKLDILKAFVFTPDSIVPHYVEIMQRPVEDVMTREPVIVEPDLPLTRVVDLLVRTRNKSFPVVEDARVVGMIAREDVLGALRRASIGKGPE